MKEILQVKCGYFVVGHNDIVCNLRAMLRVFIMCCIVIYILV